MQHGMAIRADGHQVFSRVELVLLTNGRQRFFVVDMDEFLADLTIELFKIHSTNSTVVTMLAQTFFAGFFIALIRIYGDSSDRSFNVWGAGG